MDRDNEIDGYDHRGWRFYGRVQQEIERLERRGLRARDHSIIVIPNAGLWRRIGNRTFYRMYGLRYEHDIQQALNIARSRVFIKDGVYTPTTTINIPSVTGSYTTDSALGEFNHLYIEGESPNAIISGSKLPSGTSALMQYSVSSQAYPPELTIEHLQLDAAGVASYALYLYASPEGVYPHTLRDVIFSNASNTAFFMQGMGDGYYTNIKHLYNNITRGSQSFNWQVPSGRVNAVGVIVENYATINASLGFITKGAMCAIGVQGYVIHISDLDFYNDLPSYPAFAFIGGTVTAVLDSVYFVVLRNPRVVDMSKSLYGQLLEIKNSTIYAAYSGTQYIIGNNGGTGRGSVRIVNMPKYDVGPGTTLKVNEDTNILLAMKNTYLPGGPFFISASQLTNGQYTSITAGTSYPNLTRLDVMVWAQVTLSATSSAAATAQLSINGTVVDETQAPAGSVAGQIHTLKSIVPAGQLFEITLTNATLSNVYILPIG
jgi:hypothetical protein